VAVEEEHTLTHAYRTRQNPLLPAPQGQGLNDLYVRFFRMAERQIVESTTRGIVCFVSNYSWLDGLSHPGMRERYLTAFDQIYIDSLNGDRFRTGKTTPDGLPDPSIFSTEFNREGIQVGTAVATLIRRGNHTSATTVQFRDLWGTGKRAQLQAEAATLPSIAYEALKPAPEIGLPFLPRKIGTSYLTWAKLPELFPTSFPGVKTSRDDVLVDVDKARLESRMAQYFDPNLSHADLQRLAPGFMSDSARYNAQQVRDTLRRRGFLPNNVVRYAYRPFDVRWLYWEPETKLLDEKRPDYFSHVQPGNVWLVSQQKPRREWSMPQAIRSIGCLDLMDRSASCIPLYLYHAQTHGRADTAMPLEGRTPNLSDKARAYLTTLGLTPDVGVEPLFYHALAVLHSPVYRFEHSGALRQDWPRVPLPTTHEALLASAALGREVAALLNVETPVPAVTQGNPRDDLRSVAVLTTTDGKAPDFVGNAGWGRSQGGTVMPGRGRMAEAEGRVDVYLNDTTYWRGVPTEAWAYTLGGYQVLKKWLSYRETAVLGRPLQADEAREFMHICRRLTALLALTAALDANYHRATGHHP
jgi:predicted helicase